MFSPSPFTKILAKCHQATASDLPFYDIFAPQKITFSKISDDVIACDLWFGPPPIKNPGYAYAIYPQLVENSFKQLVNLITEIIEKHAPLQTASRKQKRIN